MAAQNAERAEVSDHCGFRDGIDVSAISVLVRIFLRN